MIWEYWLLATTSPGAAATADGPWQDVILRISRSAHLILGCRDEHHTQTAVNLCTDLSVSFRLSIGWYRKQKEIIAMMAEDRLCGYTRSVYSAGSDVQRVRSQAYETLYL